MTITIVLALIARRIDRLLALEKGLNDQRNDLKPDCIPAFLIGKGLANLNRDFSSIEINIMYSDDAIYRFKEYPLHFILGFISRCFANKLIGDTLSQSKRARGHVGMNDFNDLAEFHVTSNHDHGERERSWGNMHRPCASPGSCLGEC